MDICFNFYPEISPDLNVAAVGVVEGASGPGRRLVVWTQGCAKRCPGCINTPYLGVRSAERLSVSTLLGSVESTPGCDGLTLSGGEPFLQAEAFIPLLESVRALGLTTVCYTGYRLEELSGSVAERFLGLVDLLVDGEYRRDLTRGGVYRPSNNQRLHFLSGRIRPEQCSGVAETVVQIAGTRGTAIGTLPSAVRRAIREALAKRGVAFEL